jgi:hypothetical protein
MQVSRRVPFDDPFVLNVVRAVYLASSALPHPEEFILVMHEGHAKWTSTGFIKSQIQSDPE